MAHQTNSPPIKDDDPLSFLKLLAEASAIFLGITFVVGWSYLASYYRTFGVNPFELDIPVPVVATLALHMLYDAVWPLPAAIFILAGLAFGAKTLTHWHGHRKVIALVALVGVLFCSAVAGIFRGRNVANASMLEESAELPLAAFSAKSGSAQAAHADQPSCVAFQTFGDMSCKLLLHSKGVYYFFKPISKSLAKTASSINLYMLPDSEVLAVHIQRGVDLEDVAK